MPKSMGVAGMQGWPTGKIFWYFTNESCRIQPTFPIISNHPQQLKIRYALSLILVREKIQYNSTYNPGVTAKRLYNVFIKPSKYKITMESSEDRITSDVFSSVNATHD